MSSVLFAVQLFLFFRVGLTPGRAAEEITAKSCRVLLLGGRDVEGEIEAITAHRFHVRTGSGEEGASETVALSYHEMREIRFASALREGPALAPRALDAGDDAVRRLPDRPDARAFLRFASGEVLPGKILSADTKSLRLLVRGRRTKQVPYGEAVGELTVPLAAVAAFRLREAYASDAAFEETLEADRPRSDTVFVRRGGRLLRVEGVFRGIDEEHVSVEFRGKRQRIARNLVQGVALTEVAGKRLERGDEGILVLAGHGRMPVVLSGLAGDTEDPKLRVDVQGPPWEVSLRDVRRMLFASDRIRFLSDLEPAKVEEVPFFDHAVPHRRDLSAGGVPLKLGGVEYRKGLGVHSRTILEYALADDFATFAARVGIQDTIGTLGDASVQVLGDGRSLFKGRVRGGESPLEVLVSIDGVKMLRLETDFGADGVGIGDHVDWAEARVVKAGRKAKVESSKEER